MPTAELGGAVRQRQDAVPVAQVGRKEARNAPPAPAVSKAPVGRTVACEAVVSVLTEVAKQLPPGRCIT